MKKMFVLLIVVAVTSAAFGQIKKGPETKILKNRFDIGAYFNYEFDTADEPVSTTAFTIPYARYNLETSQGENNKFYLDGDMSYNFTKTVIDGEAPEGADQFGTVLDLHIDPRFRFYVTHEMLKGMGGEKKKAAAEDETWNDWEDAEEPVTKGDGKWFFQVGLPITYQMITPQNENRDSETSTFVDADIRIGFDNKKVDIVKKTPWGKFEKGWMAYGLFEYRLVETYYGEDTDTKPLALGLAGDYSYELDSWISDAAVKGFLTFKYQMADEAMLVIPKTAAGGEWRYFGKSMNLRYGFEYAQDFTDFLNVNLTMAYNTIQLLDDPEDDSQNFLEMFGRVNFYLPSMPDLNIWGGIDWTGHLPEELDYTPDFNFTIGAEYRFDLIAFKQRQSEKKTEETEEEDYEW